MNVVFIGFMGTGKSTLGKLIAAALSYEFVDTDRLIEEREGRSVAAIFAADGEARFRKIEAEVARELSRGDRMVIAGGGGFPINPDNIELLRKNGLIITLTALPPVILERVGRDQTRPLLHVPDPLQTIETLLRERAVFYRNCDLTVDTSGAELNEAEEKCLEFLRKKGIINGKNQS